MKQVVSISLGPKTADFELDTEFLGHAFSVRRLGTDGDLNEMLDLLLQWDGKADAIGLGSMKFPNAIGPKHVLERRAEKIRALSERVNTPVTMGSALRSVVHEWAIRHVEFVFGNYFDNARVFFFSGLANHKIARILNEFTDNMIFADPILENGIGKFIKSVRDLELYASGIHEVLKWFPGKKFSASLMPVRLWNIHLMKKALQQAQVIVVPHYDFYRYLENTGLEELGRKIIITSCAYEDRVTFLQERGVDAIIDTAPKVLEKVVGLNVLEAMMLAALGKKQNQIIDDDILEIICDQNMAPRVVYPSGTSRRVNRFAFVIHPLSQEFLKKEKTLEVAAEFAPSLFMDAVEKVIAYAPPFIYSKVTGIKSPTGVEAEGWLITVGGTPKQMLAHKPEFTYDRLLQAAKMAKRLGAQIMGLGAFTKVVGDAGVTVAKKADIPITTGNSYSASGALWAAADAVRRMGLIKVEKGKSH